MCPAAGDGSPADASPPNARSQTVRAAETAAARSDFHRAAAGGDPRRTGSSASGRSRALQAFFVANSGRGLMPSGETSGVLSPNLKTEET